MDLGSYVLGAPSLSHGMTGEPVAASWEGVSCTGRPLTIGLHSVSVPVSRVLGGSDEASSRFSIGSGRQRPCDRIRRCPGELHGVDDMAARECRRWLSGPSWKISPPTRT